MDYCMILRSKDVWMLSTINNILLDTHAPWIWKHTSQFLYCIYYLPAKLRIKTLGGVWRCSNLMTDKIVNKFPENPIKVKNKATVWYPMDSFSNWWNNSDCKSLPSICVFQMYFKYNLFWWSLLQHIKYNKIGTDFDKAYSELIHNEHLLMEWHNTIPL